MASVQVTTWYLEMTAAEQLAPAPPNLPELEVRQAEVPSPELSRALYAGVGSRWMWTDRLGWSWARWHERLAREAIETWVAWVRGTPAGYAELERDADAVELVSFGLLPAFFGRGYGPRLLDAVVRHAWTRAPNRVWVRGTPAGYAELERDADAVELVSFGLLPAFFGRGYGPRLLDAVVRHAWTRAPNRVWVHTCSLDGPAALRTYQARGFAVYDERTGPREVPDAPPEPWPGAGPQAA